MEKAYKDLDIQFLPDSIIRQKLTAELTSFSNSFNSQPSEILSQNHFIQAKITDTFLTNVHFGTNLILNHIEKLN